MLNWRTRRHKHEWCRCPEERRVEYIAKKNHVEYEVFAVWLHPFTKITNEVIWNAHIRSESDLHTSSWKTLAAAKAVCERFAEQIA